MTLQTFDEICGSVPIKLLLKYTECRYYKNVVTISLCK